MNRTQVDTGFLNRFLARDSTVHLPRDSADLFTPQDSWSGATFVRWRADRGPMLAKIWPADGPELAAHELRHRVLKDLGDFEPPLALPVPDSNGQTLRITPDGRVAELFVWLDGESSPSNPSEAMIVQAFRTIARLHVHWAASFGRHAGIADSIRKRLAALQAYRSGGIRTAREEVLRVRHAHDEIRTRFIEILNLAEKLTPLALEQLSPLAHQPLPLQFVMRDVRPNHFLWKDLRNQCRAVSVRPEANRPDSHVIDSTSDEPVLSGIVDFGAIGIDTVAADLARLMGEWNLFDPWKRSIALDAYESIRPMEPAEVTAIEPLAMAAAILGGLAWIDLHFRQKRTVSRDDALIHSLAHAETRLRTQLERHIT